MTPEVEGPSGREKAIAVLRWLCVLPAAALGGFAVKIIVGLALRFARQGGGVLAGSPLFALLQLVVVYVPKEAAFVIAGAAMAPRGRRATAIILAVVGIVMSLVVHVLGQRQPGIVNYTHFAAETAGLAFGVAGMFFWEYRFRRGARD